MSKQMPKQQPATSEQEVGTPLDFLRAVRRRLGISAFAIDLAASAENAVCPRFYSKEDNSLVQPWVFAGWNWLNPEFSDIAPWAERCFTASREGAHIALLTPASVGSNWWRDWVHQKAFVLLLNGRLTFVGHKQPYPKDITLSLYGPDIAPGYDVWNWQSAIRKERAA